MLPRLYPIVDAACFASANDPLDALLHHARELIRAGANILQYRDKSNDARQFLTTARELRRLAGRAVQLVMNDRADLCLAANFDGVHVGQDDLSPADVRTIIGPHRLVGFSTHNPEQVKLADAMPVDSIAVGPVFATSSKANPDPVIGLEGIRLARQLTGKPLVAIGGITRATCRSVVEAGADSVAVISDLLERPYEAAAEFLHLLSPQTAQRNS